MEFSNSCFSEIAWKKQIATNIVHLNAVTLYNNKKTSNRIEEEVVYPNIEKLPPIESTYQSLSECVKDYCAIADRKLNSLRCTKREINESIVWDDLSFSSTDDDLDYDCISNIRYLDLQGIRIQSLYYGYDVPIEQLIRINLMGATFENYDVEVLVEFLHSVQILEVSDNLSRSKIVEFLSPDNLISEITTPSFYYWMTNNYSALIKYDRRLNCASSYLIDDLTTIEKYYCLTDNHTHSMWTSLVSTSVESSSVRPSPQTKLNKSVLSTTTKPHYEKMPTAHKLTRNDDDLYEELERSVKKSNQSTINSTEFKKGATFLLVTDSKRQATEVSQINDKQAIIGNDQVKQYKSNYQFHDTIVLVSVIIVIFASILTCILLYFR